ncbi:creatininase family protein [Cesiribacter andamanensis]|uniref:Creatinine amidohydrolase n=1 Tax=Cesiribacter andamanensis AMV16 TaxID=1279009 RepID=M7N403_9BACT|nr:creatininase family protein [Cesiribacter andamanensis]EMR03398.1 Creatinine amidohydrolase [Cesiribacter andamanensis AMV16]
MRPYLLAESNWKAVKEQPIELVILPWGATEAHNYHLPYATDIIEADAIVAEAGRLAWEQGAKIMILPTLPFGVNTGQPDIRLDINLNPSTQLAILRDIVEMLNRQGLRKLLILNSHGGNDFKPMLRELGLAYPQMLLVSCNWFQSVDKKAFFKAAGDHADEMETSLLLHLRPELVLPLAEAGDGSERKSVISGIREGWAWSERKWSMVTADTGVGNPKAATAEKGARYFAAVCEKMAQLFVELAAVDPEKRYQ